jgi:protein-disulfide isomerase
MVVLAFGVAIAAAVALIGAALLLQNDNEAAAPNPVATVDFTGIPQDGPLLGAESASVTLIEYADLQCPVCRAYTEQVFPTLLEEYVRPGKIRTEFRGLAFIGNDSEEALRYAYAAGLQDRLWEMQEALFRNQGGENSGWVTEELARSLGAEIDGLDVDRMIEDAQSDEVTAMIDESAAQAQAGEVMGTPTFFVQIGDREPYMLEITSLDPAQFRPALDDALNG